MFNRKPKPDLVAERAREVFREEIAKAGPEILAALASDITIVKRLVRLTTTGSTRLHGEHS